MRRCPGQPYGGSAFRPNSWQPYGGILAELGRIATENQDGIMPSYFLAAVWRNFSGIRTNSDGTPGRHNAVVFPGSYTSEQMADLGRLNLGAEPQPSYFRRISGRKWERR